MHLDKLIVGISFFTAIAMVILVAGKKIYLFLDSYVIGINKRIIEAENLKQQSILLLQETEEKYDLAKNNATQLLSEANKNGEQLLQTSTNNFKRKLQHKLSQSISFIQKKNQKSIADIQNKVVTLATSLAKDQLKGDDSQLEQLNPIPAEVKNMIH